MTTNETRYATHIREAVEHLLNYLATEDNSEFPNAFKALEAADNDAATPRESSAVKFLAVAIFELSLEHAGASGNTGRHAM